MKIFSFVVAIASAADKCFICKSRQYAIPTSDNSEPAKHFDDAEYDLCFKPQADEYDGLNGRPLVAECNSGCLSLGYMIKNKDPTGKVENYEYFIERGCKDDLFNGSLATCENEPEWDSNGKTKTAWCEQDLTFANHGNHGTIKARYSKEPVNYKKSWLNDANAGLELTEDPRLTCFSEHVVSETSIQAPLNKTRCEMYTNSCYSIVANLDGIDMNDQDAKWSYAKRGCSSAFEQETETIFFKAQIPGTMANSTMQATFCDKANCNNHMAEWTSSDATHISIISTLLFTTFAML